MIQEKDLELLVAERQNELAKEWGRYAKHISLQVPEADGLLALENFVIVKLAELQVMLNQYVKSTQTQIKEIKATPPSQLM